MKCFNDHINEMIFFSKSAKRPQKIGGGGNVATIGNLDITALLTYDTPDMLEELLTVAPLRVLIEVPGVLLRTALVLLRTALVLLRTALVLLRTLEPLRVPITRPELLRVALRVELLRTAELLLRTPVALLARVRTAERDPLAPAIDSPDPLRTAPE